MLPKFSEDRKSKRGTYSAIISGFVGLPFKGVSSFLHTRIYKAFDKAVSAMSTKTDIQRSKLMHLENTLVMYGIYNVEMLERLIKQYTHYTADRQCTKAYFAGRTSVAYGYYSQMHGE